MDPFEARMGVYGNLLNMFRRTHSEKVVQEKVGIAIDVFEILYPREVAEFRRRFSPAPRP